MPRRLRTSSIPSVRPSRRLAATLVFGLIVIAGCTSGGSADDSSVATTGDAATTTAAETQVDFGIETAAPSTSPGRSVTDLPGSVPDTIALTGGPGAVIIDRSSGNEFTVFAPAPLEIGQDPAESERLTAMVDAGEHGYVVSRSLVGRAEVGVVGPDRTFAALGDGHSPVVDADARRVAWIDGADVVVAELPDGTARRLPVDGMPQSMAWRPGTAELAVGVDDAGTGKVLVVDTSPTATATAFFVAAPVNVDWTLPTWMDTDRLAVVEQTLQPGDAFNGLVASGEVRVVVTDLTANRLETTAAIDFGVVHADASPDGEALALTGTDGIVRWWSHGTVGLLVAGVWGSATW